MFMNRTILRILNSSGLRMIFKDLMKIYSKFNTKSNDLLMMHKNRCQSIKLWFQKYLNLISNYQNIIHWCMILKVFKHDFKSIKTWF